MTSQAHAWQATPVSQFLTTLSRYRNKRYQRVSWNIIVYISNFTPKSYISVNDIIFFVYKKPGKTLNRLHEASTLNQDKYTWYTEWPLQQMYTQDTVTASSHQSLLQPELLIPSETQSGSVAYFMRICKNVCWCFGFLYLVGPSLLIVTIDCWLVTRDWLVLINLQRTHWR